MRDKYEQEKGQVENSFECIDWAFAGKSHSTAQGAREGGKIKLCHTVWDHWIDSNSEDPGVDEGDMWVQRDGDTLERGKQKNPDTGEETEYEELWHDLDVMPMGKKQNRSSVVMKLDDPEKHVKGMAVKIGGWCQGILKAGNDLTVERWWKSDTTSDSETQEHTFSDKASTRNGWVRTFKCGQGILPCEYICSNTTGKLGMNSSNRIHPDSQNELRGWKVLEEYYW